MRRTIRLTESQLIGLIEKIVLEQTTIPKPVGNWAYKTAPSDATQSTNFNGQQTNPIKRSDVENFDNPATPLDDHQLATMISFFSAFIPVVGPFISAGVSLYDAKKYYDEGDKKTATINAIFAVLPGISNIASRIPELNKIGEAGLKNLSNKLAKYTVGTKFTPIENQVLNGVNRNFNLIKGQIKPTNFKTIATNVVKNGLKDPVLNAVAKGAVNYEKTNIKKEIVAKIYDLATEK